MMIVDVFFSIIIIIVIALMSFFFLITEWWLLFMKPINRIKIANKILMTPWAFIVTRLFLFMRLKIIGKENVDKKRRTLYICNHQSWVDIATFVMYSRSIAISKKEVKWIPFIGPLTQYSGTIYVDRKDTSSRISLIKEVRTLFDSGNSLSFFPEGTRSRDGRILRPNYTLLKLCYKMGVPVVPSALEGTRHILPRDRSYFKFFQKVVLQYNSPIYPKDFDNADDFCNACWNGVKETYNGIVKNYF